MRTSLLLTTTSLAAAFLVLASPVEASPRGVGLGTGLGVAVPHGELSYDPSLNWGFFVDIPIISTFHITPSTMVYGIRPKGQSEGISATDVSLNFKFMIPLGSLELFAGITAGLTSTRNLDPHVGGLAGISLNLFSNIDLFAQVNYRVLFDGDTNTKDLMAFGGPLFRFY